jgi:hypothetical protein
LGFEGAVVADYFSVAQLLSFHRVASTRGEAAALALAAKYGLADDESAPAPVEIICGELRTGRILTTAPVSDASWSMVYNDAGTIECAIPLASMPLHDAAELVGYLDETRCYLAAVTGDSVLEAGPIWTPDYNDDTKTLNVKAAGLWSLFDRRFLMKVLTPGERPQETSLSWTGLSLGTHAKRVVQTMMAHPGGSLPLVLPPDEAGEHDREWRGYELTPAGDALRQLMSVEGGPDISFEPRFTTDRLRVEWVMRVGTNAQPLVYQSGGDWRWDTTTPMGLVSGLSVKRDTSRLGYRAWAVGAGGGSDGVMSMREDLAPTAAGYPLLEVADSQSSEPWQSIVDAQASALLAGARRPWMTWSWTVQAGAYPRLGDYRPGDWALINVPPDHPYLRALGIRGEYRARLLSVSGDLGDKVQLSAAPTMEAR